MNIRSILNKGLLLIPVVFVAPLLAIASPAPVCNPGGGPFTPTLNPNSTVSLTEGSPIEFAAFLCSGVLLDQPTNLTGVTINDGTQFSDTVSWFTGGAGTGAFTGIFFSSDADTATSTGAEAPVVLTGKWYTAGGPSSVTFTLASDNGTPSVNSDTVSVSVSPEPGSMLLFGTGLLIAGGFARRRLLAHTLA